MDRVLAVLPTVSVITFIILVIWYLFSGGGQSFTPIPIKERVIRPPDQNGDELSPELSPDYRKYNEGEVIRPLHGCFAKLRVALQKLHGTP